MNANSHRGERVHRALGYTFRLTGALEPRLAPLFTSMIDRTPAEDPAALAEKPETTHIINVDRTLDSETFRLDIDGTVSFRTTDLGALVHQTVWELTQRAVASRSHSVVLHAAVAIVGDVTIIISGRSGSGKSTLVSELVETGGAYVTDEAAVVERSGVVVDGIGRPIHLSRVSVDMLARRADRTDVPMPGGGIYHRPRQASPANLPGRAVIVRLDDVAGPLRTATPRRSDVIAGLVHDSFPSYALTQAGLQSVKELSRRSTHMTLSGGSVAERAHFVKHFARMTQTIAN